MHKISYKGKQVTVVRAANAGDGDDFDPSILQVLVRDDKGNKHLVAFEEIQEPKNEHDSTS